MRIIMKNDNKQNNNITPHTAWRQQPALSTAKQKQKDCRGPSQFPQELQATAYQEL